MLRRPIIRRLTFICAFLALGLTVLSLNIVWTKTRETIAPAPATTAPAPVVMPVITANKTAALATDVNNNGFVNPGDTLMYSVTVTNTGTEATNVSITDTLDSNLTLVPGSVNASPIATNDMFSSYGNVGINVPANVVLANDLDPNGTTPTLTGYGATLATANGTMPGSNVITSNGGTVVMLANGSFTYNPAAGFEGNDVFFYTISDGSKTDTAQVTINVSGMVWFINSSAANCTSLASGCGRLSNPFSSIAAFHSLNNGSVNNPGTGDAIFLFTGTGNYAGPLTLLNNQKLIGQGATATLATIANIMLPTFSNMLPTTNGTRPVLAHSATNLTVAQGNLLRGFNITNTGGTGLSGNNFGTLTTSEISVSNTNGTDGISLNTGSLAASFTSVSTTTCSNGINLNATTGSFTVTGTGTAGSGGTITGSSGPGILLNNVQGISLSSMNVQNGADDGIRGTTVNGFTTNGCSVTSNGNAIGENGIELNNLSGTASFTSTMISMSAVNNVFIDNLNTSLSSLTFNGCTISNTALPFGNNGLLVQMRGNSTLTSANVMSSAFSNIFATALQFGALDTATISGVTVQTSTFANNNNHINMAQSQGGKLSFNIQNNSSLLGAMSHAINVSSSAASTVNSLIDGRVVNNLIGNAATPGSGSATGNGIRMFLQGQASSKILVDGNTIRQTPLARGIEITSGSIPGVQLTLTNNNVNPQDTTGFPLAAIYAVADNTTGMGNGSLCADIRNNTVPAGNTFDIINTFLILHEEMGFGTTQLLDTAPADANATAQLTSNNFGSAAAGAGVSLVTSGCPVLPPMIVFNETQKLAPEQNNLNASVASRNNSWMTRLQNLIQPLFASLTASVSNFDLSQTTEWLIPKVEAAESTTRIPSRGARAINARTASSSAMAGETVIVNGAGSGFLLPAGESTVLMFQATIEASFTGTSVSNQGTISGTNFTPIVTNDPNTAAPMDATVTPVIQPPVITKAFASDFVSPGATVNLTFTITNPNPGQSLSGIGFTDQLPVDWAVADSGPIAQCGGTLTTMAANRTIALSAATIAGGSNCTFMIPVTASSTEGQVTNTTSTVSAAESTAGAAASDSITVITPPTLTKSFTPNMIPLGSTSSLSFELKNPNTTLALNGIQFTDSLPAGITAPNTAATTVCGDGSYSIASNVITFTKPSLAANGTCNFSVTVTGAAAGMKTNTTSTVTTTNSNAGTAASANATVVEQADLELTKGDAPDPVIAGNNLTYTLNLVNNGPTGANTVAVSDVIPTGTTFVSASATSGMGWAVASPAVGGTGTVTFSKATMALNETATLQIVVKVPSNTASGTTISNTATVSTASSDPTSGNNSATAMTTVSTSADLAVTKSDSPDPVNAGENITYTVNFTNNGPSNASTVTVTDAVPASTTFVSATASTGMGWSVTSPAVGGTGNVVFSKASVAASEAAIFQIVVKVASSTANGTSISNTATAVSNTTDAAAGNNSATESTTVQTQADLAITKTDGATTAVPGQSVTYTIVASNAGPSDAPSTTVADTLPASLTSATWTCVGAVGGTCTAAGSGNINDTVNLPAGASVTYTVNATVSASATGTLANTATVTAGAGVTDSMQGNNSATDTDTLTPQADLSITKTDGVTTVIPGNSITYTIVASNAGPSDAPSATVADTLPASLTGATWTCVGAVGGTCTAAGSGNINDTVNLPAGASVTYTVNATVSASATGTLVNTATVTAGAGVTDSTPGNNSATDNDTLTPQADLAVTKSGAPDTVLPGNNITYTVNFTNNGASNASTVTVTDAVPANTTFVSASVHTGMGWTAASPMAGGTGNVVFSKAAVAASEAAIFQIVVKVNTGIPNGTVITNTATAASTTTDPNEMNNSAMVTTATNAAPTITAVGVTRTAGSPASNGTIANVNDAEDAKNTLNVKVNGGATATAGGITVSNIQVNNMGVVTADVVAACGATTTDFTLRVTDSQGAFNEAMLKVTVSANTAPTLAYASQVMAGEGQTLTVNPTNGPSDNGSVSSIIVDSVSAGFGGTVTVDNTTGVVTINNAGPIGTYTVTVKATDNCGEMTSTSFTLTVIPFIVSISDPIICTGDNNTLTVHAEVTNPNPAAVNVDFNATLPAQLSGVAGSCIASVGTCTVNAGSVTVNGTLAANQTVFIDYKVLVANGTPQGTKLCIDSTASFNGGAPATVQACTTLNCPPNPANVKVSDQKAGSVLVFPYYNSRAAQQKDTRLTISNAGEQQTTAHIFFIDGASCQQADMFVCLTPNASVSFKASEYDPEMTGWLLVVAVDNKGVPIQNNSLIGNAFVNDGEYVDNYGAEAFRANSRLVALVDNFTAKLFFDGGSYDAVPNQFAVELQSPIDVIGQKIVTAGLSGDLNFSQMTGAGQAGIGHAINGNEKPAGSFSNFLTGKCFATATFSTTNPRVPGGMGQIIPSGQVGTVKLNTGPAVGLLMTPKTSKWSGIRTLHKTSVTTSTITIPLFVPVC